MIDNGSTVKNAKVLVLGITFKENCPDIRNTGVTNVINRLNEFGLNTTIYDPWASAQEVFDNYKLVLSENINDKKFDAILLAVGHNEFKKLNIDDLKNKSNSIVYDVKGILDNCTHKL